MVNQIFYWQIIISEALYIFKFSSDLKQFERISNDFKNL